MTLRRGPTLEEVDRAFADAATTQIQTLLPAIDWHALSEAEEDISG
jgi:hypothetical protein